MKSERRSVTINDVARVAGVSRAAVSKVIRNAAGVSPEMRERVGLAIAELGYRPSLAARAMRGSSYRLGLEIPHLNARFMTQIVDGAKRALVGTPYQLVLAPADGPEYGAIEALADGLVDGIIAVSPLVDPAWLEELSLRVPVVMLGRHDRAGNYDTVVGDDVSGTRDVMDHLLRLGHRRIAHLTEAEPVTVPGSGTPHALRLQVYLDCMAEAGLGSLVSVARRGPGEDGARRAAAELLAGAEPPTAIFAAHDDIAIGALAGVADSRPGVRRGLRGGLRQHRPGRPPVALPDLGRPVRARDGGAGGHDAAGADPGQDRAPGASRDAHPAGPELDHASAGALRGTDSPPRR